MTSSGKTLGLVLIGIGLAIGLAVGAWLIAAVADDSTGVSGAVFGFALLMVFIVLPLVGGGIYILSKGRAEERQLAEVREQRALLDIVKTRGQVQISDLVLELKSTRDKVQADLHALVGRGLFSGYVDWDKGILYSVEASQLNGRQTCPNCGGQLQLAGKGLIKCPYCGAEIFL
jgi:ribosomal protein S27AE